MTKLPAFVIKDINSNSLIKQLHKRPVFNRGVLKNTNRMFSIHYFQGSICFRTILSLTRLCQVYRHNEHKRLKIIFCSYSRNLRWNNDRVFHLFMCDLVYETGEKPFASPYYFHSITLHVWVYGVSFFQMDKKISLMFKASAFT